MGLIHTAFGRSTLKAYRRSALKARTRFTPLPDPVYRMVVHADKLWMVGDFEGRLASWDGSAFEFHGTPTDAPIISTPPESRDAVGVNEYRQSWSMMVFDSKLWVAGPFTEFAGIDADHVAVFDGTSWSDPGTGLPAADSGLVQVGLGTDNVNAFIGYRHKESGTWREGLYRLVSGTWERVDSPSNPYSLYEPCSNGGFIYSFSGLADYNVLRSWGTSKTSIAKVCTIWYGGLFRFHWVASDGTHYVGGVDNIGDTVPYADVNGLTYKSGGVWQNLSTLCFPTCACDLSTGVLVLGVLAGVYQFTKSGSAWLELYEQAGDIPDAIAIYDGDVYVGGTHKNPADTNEWVGLIRRHEGDWEAVG